MPVQYARFLVGRHRTHTANRQLGWSLAFVAGALNAGGFLAVQTYTSHVTGRLSSLADELALGHLSLVVDALVGVAAFVLGAMACAVLVNFARRRHLSSTYALPLMLEAALILVFGLMGARLSQVEGVLLLPATVVLLCFVMGLQNAVVTKLSGAVIRTTHMTGVVTDLGIELGKLVYWNRSERDTPPVRANPQRFVVLGGLLASFMAGAIAGAFGFQKLGYVSSVPLALVLAALAAVPLADDWRRRPWRSRG